MPFTTIVNPTPVSHREEPAMSTRQLEKPPPRGSQNKGSAKAQPKETATLVLANGEPLSESARLGLALVGAGLTAGAIALLEGMARKGKLDWWAKLSPRARGMVMVAFTLVSGYYARRWRKAGKSRQAAAMEAAAIAAWTLAIIYFTEAGPGGGEVQGLGDLTRRAPGEMKLDELSALDSQIDDDIRGAVDRLAELARAERREAEQASVGALAVAGDSLIDLDDDEALY